MVFASITFEVLESLAGEAKLLICKVIAKTIAMVVRVNSFVVEKFIVFCFLNFEISLGVFRQIYRQFLTNFVLTVFF